MLYLVSLGLFLPLIGFLLLTATSTWLSRRATAFIGCSTIFFSFACFTSLLYVYEHIKMSPQLFTLFSWIPVAGINADFALYLDPLSLLMTLIITGVGFLIHVYSIGYIDHEEDFVRYFSFLNFFVFCMLLLVLSANLLLLFVGWEGVGLASYLLIGYWYQKPIAAQAATKAFVVNRIGDLGLLLGLLLTFQLFGGSDIAMISRQAGELFAIGAPILTLLTMLYFFGAVGKSAQIPLHIWLPDAMAGPTPVSALIHAATMVTAGVYLVVRLHTIFMLAPMTLQVIGIIGGVTSLFAALCAVGQTDLKRVLAYSTVSQLGLMFLACGAGAFYAAMFHLTTHAFVKALLFLSAGNVVHMLHGTTEMADMGGLKKAFSYTHWFFLIGVLALSGIPPLAAFFSKDLILEEEHLLGYNTLFYIGLTTSTLTAFYLMRAYCLTFRGTPRLAADVLAEVQEAPKVMLIPVGILAFLSIVGGFLGCCGNIGPLRAFLGEVDITLPEIAFKSEAILSSEAIMATIGGVLGIGLAIYLYRRYRGRLGRRLPLLTQSFFIDEFYEKSIVTPVKAVAYSIANFFEPTFFDGSVRAASLAAMRSASALQRMQSGQIRSYVAWIVLGSVVAILYLGSWR